uniref:ATP synthase protein 8 n=1 Tax=Flammulina velutipes TaxID=38945 RepID=M9MU49_FLAVE|nr:ATP synthase subunit 8 [Flammulina velutipes]AEF33896.1 ATP synthase subunit 8 [Flammulina velutipes]AEO19624.1 ATP synthase subunit 8 [Flammulina velutipes]AEO19656.1 ATP synthase subunit 8 [Flammulina velutipes]AEO19687.1 ATP synthase subunit 8 [Flammulina velutipes]
MPQVIPFFFLNQIVSSFVILFLLVYIFSVYFLPLFTLQQVIRIYITKLSKNN